jgi:hypothetical protein
MARCVHALSTADTACRRRLCDKRRMLTQKNAYAQKCKRCYYDLSHHRAPKFAMPDREVLRISR